MYFDFFNILFNCRFYLLCSIKETYTLPRNISELWTFFIYEIKTINSNLEVNQFNFKKELMGWKQEAYEIQGCDWK